MTKERNYSLEILRIWAKKIIVILHYFNHGGILNTVKFRTLNHTLVYFIESMCIIAVNLYILISGYFMIDKEKISLKKVFDLLLKVFIYSSIIYIILLLTNSITFNFEMAIKSFFPFLTKSYWFFSAYIGLYILSPYINKLANNCNQK